MTETFDSEFHRWYVGGKGIVVEKPLSIIPVVKLKGISMEDVLFEYRRYVGDLNAQLPEAVLKTFLANQETENDGK